MAAVSLLYRPLKPLLFRLDAERAHGLVTSGLGGAVRLPGLPRLLRALYQVEHPALRVDVGGLAFANPTGLAAGFDKHATLIAPLALLGFGHVEVGTVTPRAQPGNPRPRLFRLPDDGALINRMGFNSPGMAAAARHLAARPAGVVVGVNLGKNRTTPLDRAADDYAAAFAALAPLADYVAVNISSPNTPGLRRLHERHALAALLARLTAANAALPAPRPIWLKVSPDESAAELDAVIDVALAAGIAGFIAGNTTLAREGLCSPRRVEAGGLSGRPLQPRARAVIARIYRATDGRVPIIGVGGIATACDAYRAIRAGASLVQLYTGLIYEGPGVAAAISRGLIRLLHRDGFRRVREAVGADARLAAD